MSLLNSISAETPIQQDLMWYKKIQQKRKLLISCLQNVKRGISVGDKF